MRFRVALALAETRRDIVEGRHDAIAHLVRVQPEIRAAASPLALPYAWAVLGTFVLVGGTSVVIGILAALPVG
jgi:hypothetical protein